MALNLIVLYIFHCVEFVKDLQPAVDQAAVTVLTECSCEISDIR